MCKEKSQWYVVRYDDTEVFVKGLKEAHAVGVDFLLGVSIEDETILDLISRGKFEEAIDLNNLHNESVLIYQPDVTTPRTIQEICLDAKEELEAYRGSSS